MTYRIYYADPAKTNYPITVADNTLYKGVGTGGLTLVGRNYPGYGQPVAENFIRLLENSANAVPPENPIEGQLWYDNNTRKLRFNDGAANNTNWKPINGIYQQTTQPSDAVDGDIWVDLTSNQVKFFAQNSWKIVGPDYSDTSSSGPKVETVIDSVGGARTVVNMYVNNEVCAVFSTSSFVTGSIAGFQAIQTGINIKDFATYGSIFNGTADSSNSVRQSGVKVSGNSLVRNDVDQTINGKITLTQDFNAFRIGTEPTFILERTVGGSNANFVNTYNSFGTFSFNIKDSTFANLRVMTIGGNPQQVRINATTQATTTTGALYVEGGANFKKDVYIGGQMYFTNVNSTLTIAKLVLTASTASVSTTTGALVVSGGTGIAGDLYLGGDLNIKNRIKIDGKVGTRGQVLVTNGFNAVYWADFLGNTVTNETSVVDLSVTGVLTLPDATNISTSTSNGTIVTAGGIGVGGNINAGGYVSATEVVVGGNAISTSSVSLSAETNISNSTESTTTDTGALVVAGGVGVGRNLNIGGQVVISDSTDATTITNGSLVIAGGVGIAKDLYVGGQIVAEKLVIQYTTITSTLIISDDIFTITNTTTSVSPETGAFVNYGGAGFGKDVYIGGTAYVQNSPVITTATFGGARIDGQSLQSQTGTISVNTSTLMNIAVNAINLLTIASSTQSGAVKIGSNVTIDTDGRISVPLATDSVFGVVRVATSSTGIWNDNNSLRVSLATTSTIGGVRVGDFLSVRSNGTIFVNTTTLMAEIIVPASATNLGSVRIGGGIDVSTSGTISVNTAGFAYVLLTATNLTLGGVRIKPIEPEILVDSNTAWLGLNVLFTATTGISVTSSWNTVTQIHEKTFGLVPAGITTIGGVKIGTGIGVSPDGTISVTTASYALQTATSIILGGVKVGSNLLATPDGAISFNTATLVTTATTARFISTTATNNQLGGIKVGTGFVASLDGTISVDPTGIYSLPTATSVTLGGVKIGTGIDAATDGKISFNTATLVTTAVRIVTTATNTQLGAIKVGSGFNTLIDGTISVNTATLMATAVQIVTTATNTQLGAIKIGSGFAAATDGTISVNTSTLMATAVRSLTTATTTQSGIVQIGLGFDINGDAVISLNTSTLMATAVNVLTPASAGTLGAVKIGSGIGVTVDGTISVNTNTLVRSAVYAVTATNLTTTATSTQTGVIKLGSGLKAIGDGTVSIDLTGIAVDSATYAQFITTPASPTQLGGVKIGTGIEATVDGTIALDTGTLVTTAVRSVTTASGIQLGVVQLSSHFTATNAGLLYFNTSTLVRNSVNATTATYISTPASAGQLGGVKIGTNIDVAGDGTISVSTGAGYILPTATTGTLGGIIGVVNTSVALGVQSGFYGQSGDSVAIGISSGNLNQGYGAVAIGAYASTSTQTQFAVSIGYFAGSYRQGDSAIAIGQGAGYESQGNNAIAIGNGSGQTNQAAGSIIINASGSPVNTSTANSFLVSPIRASGSTPHFMFYNPASKEVTTASTLANAVKISDTTQANATATGALQVAGGASVGGNIWIGGLSILKSVSTSTVNTLGTGTPTGATVYFTNLVPAKIGVYNGTAWADALGTVLF